MPLSYKAARDAIDPMNNLAEQPIVLRSTGGRHGGGTLLPDYGHQEVVLYRTLDRMTAGMDDGQAGHFQQFRQRLKRMSMKTTARNHLWGKAARILNDPVNAEVTLELSGGKTVCAVVTHDSVEKLGLALGQRACAVFKASAAILCLCA